MTEIRARHYETGEPVRIRIGGGTIAEVSTGDAGRDDEWVAPAFWDIQLNGRWGVSFSDPSLTVDQVGEIVRAQAPLGSARICPTLISAPGDAFAVALRTIAAACALDREIARRVVGIHLEGPYISGVDGYRGAHPLESVRDPDWDEFERFQEASGGRVVLMTLAPERPGAIEFIGRAVAAGVTIALGHTSADGPTMRAAADAGAKLSTHLGNGIASPLPRHPNPIWEQAAIDGLSASFIADGHHVDLATLRVLVRAKTLSRTILVSDASPLAGLPPGSYGPWAVHPTGKIVVAGTPYLAGSNQGLVVGLQNLLRATGARLCDAITTVTANPARLLGRSAPRLEAGEAANLVVFHHDEAAGSFQLVRTCVDGTWSEAGS